MGAARQETRCAECHEVIYGEPSDARRPCPSCGSTKRDYFLTLTDGVGVADAVTVVRYEDSLLQLASRLVEQNEYGVAIVVAMMACEVAVQRALSVGFEAKHIEYLEKPILGCMNGYSLLDNRNREFFRAVTGETLRPTPPFWTSYVDAVELRNDIIHDGKTAATEQAVNAIEAATQMVEYLSKLTEKMGMNAQ